MKPLMKFGCFLAAAVAAVQAASAQVTITPQIKQNIDSACQGVLGSACSTANYSVYTAITQQIQTRKLGSDSGSVMNNYLIPMVRSSTGWQANIVDSAWSSMRCAGPAPESQWMPKVAQYQTYAALYNAMKAQGCGSASANVSPAASAAQNISAAQMSAAYAVVWGGASGLAPNTTCVIPPGTAASTAALSCARTQLATYVRSHNTGVLSSVAAANYRAVTGGTLDSTHAQLLANAFGVGWSGADDLVTYLKNNPSLFAKTIVLAPLDSRGCLVDTTGAKLDPNEKCGLYHVDSKGAHAHGSYPASLHGKPVTLSSSSSSGGLLVDNQGNPVKVAGSASGITFSSVAGIVAQGGGNIVAQGGGNIVAQGGGNIVAQGGGNMLPAMSSLAAAQQAGLLTDNGAAVISNDGGSFTSSFFSMAAISALVGDNGGGLVKNPSSLISNNPNQFAPPSSANFVGQNGSSAIYSAQSVSTPMVAVIKGVRGSSPTIWPYGQAAMITWSAAPGAAACPSGYRVLLNGNKPVGNATLLSVGMSLVPSPGDARGSKVSVSLVSLCTNTPVANPYTVTIQ